MYVSRLPQSPRFLWGFFQEREMAALRLFQLKHRLIWHSVQLNFHEYEEIYNIFSIHQLPKSAILNSH